MRYERKTALLVDAIEWTGDNLKEVQNFLFPASPLDHSQNQLGINVYSPEQLYGLKTKLVFIAPGTFLVRDGGGRLTVHEADVFNEEFRLVEESSLESSL